MTSGEVSFSISEPRASALRADFEDYLDGFSPGVQDILENFEFRNQIPRLSKLLAAGAGAEVVEGELRGVVERLAGRLAERCFLLDDFLLVEPGLHVEDRLLGGFEDSVEAPEHGHGEDDIAVLAADVDVAEDIVRDAPDVVGDPVEVGGGHGVGVGVGVSGVLGPSRPHCRRTTISR